MTTRNPKGFSYAALHGVSCPSTTSCFAVGNYLKLGIEGTLIEHWNGSGWAVVPSPTPAARVDNEIDLRAVSCPTATSCFAVGTYETSDGFKTLVEHWNGSVWSVMTNSNPYRSLHAELFGLSCPSATSCFAVGTYISRVPEAQDFIHPFVQHWNGRGGWSIMSGTPSPGGYATLTAISCPTVKTCFATGYTEGSTTGAFAERWRGRGTWSIMTSLKAGSGVTLLGLSCPSTTTCFAGGGEVEHWDSTHGWTVMSDAKPPSANLNGVVCPNPSSCFAVGNQPRDSNHDKTFIERYG